MQMFQENPSTCCNLQHSTYTTSNHSIAALYLYCHSRFMPNMEATGCLSCVRIWCLLSYENDKQCCHATKLQCTHCAGQWPTVRHRPAQWEHPSFGASGIAWHRFWRETNIKIARDLSVPMVASKAFLHHEILNVLTLTVPSISIEEIHGSSGCDRQRALCSRQTASTTKYNRWAESSASTYPASTAWNSIDDYHTHALQAQGIAMDNLHAQSMPPIEEAIQQCIQ